MKFLTQRALFYSFATQEIEGGGAVEVWRAVAGFFGVSPEEERSVEKLLSGAALSGLKTAEDVRLLQKCAEGFGEAFRLSADEQETAELKYQALFKIGTLAGEYRAAPLKAVTLAYRRDPVAAVLYALQILMHNRERSALGCEILAQALSSEQSGDAGAAPRIGATPPRDNGKEQRRALIETAHGRGESIYSGAIGGQHQVGTSKPPGDCLPVEGAP